MNIKKEKLTEEVRDLMSNYNLKDILENIVDEMNPNKVNMGFREIHEILNNNCYEDVIKAIILFENENLTDYELEKLYDDYMDNHDIIGILNEDVSIMIKGRC